MKKKGRLLGIITLLVVVMVLLVGCSKTSKTTKQLSTVGTTSTTMSSTNTTIVPKSTVAQTTAISSPSTSTGNSLSNLIGKATKVNYYSYQMLLTDGTNPSQNWSVWMKTSNPIKFRMEVAATGGQPTTDVIYDGQNYYQYFPTANMAYKMSLANGQQLLGNFDKTTSQFLQYNPVLIGSENVNGLDCTVYQYTNQDISGKVWIWNQYGMPVKVVFGTETLVYSNYSFSTIADSKFQLPSGVTMTTTP